MSAEGLPTSRTRHGRITGRKSWLKLLALFVVPVLLAAGCGDDDNDSSDAKAKAKVEEATADKAITVRAGVNDTEDSTVAVLEFLPEKITVTKGSTVAWDWADTIEPHSVTFQAGATLPAPGPPDEALFAPSPPTEDFDGTVLTNSGLLPTGPGPAPEFKLTFSKSGTYQYFCAIHPLMTGSVDVVDGDDGVDSAASVTKRGDEELKPFLAEGRAAKEKLMSSVAAGTPVGGATNWTVEMGTTTEHTDILAFAPVPVAAKAGDQVTFVNNSMAPHTATFGEYGQDPNDPKVVQPAPGPSPQSLGSTGYFNTGWLPPNSPPGSGPPLAARSFTFKIPAAGKYSYVCALHVPSGMAGAIEAA
ncbi:MAG: hypothetical protein HYZ59_00635 [Actinobacteria bacterium]|nr:hypothetical protein [Actinomycetota bacterium]